MIIQELRPADVHIDPHVQRSLDKGHVARIAKEYNPDLFGMGHASLRADGLHYALDGQHRIEAAKVAHMAHVPVLFKVYTGLSTAQEAALFVKLQENRKAVHALDTFRLRVVAGDPVALDIKRILDSLGIAVAASYGNGTVSAVKALEDVYFGRCGAKRAKSQAEPELLEKTLLVLHTAWGGKREAFEGILLKGVAHVFKKYGEAVDADRLAKRLARAGTARSIVGEIHALKSFSKTTATSAALQVLQGIYNKSSRGNRLA